MPRHFIQEVGKMRFLRLVFCVSAILTTLSGLAYGGVLLPDWHKDPKISALEWGTPKSTASENLKDSFIKAKTWTIGDYTFKRDCYDSVDRSIFGFRNLAYIKDALVGIIITTKPNTDQNYNKIVDFYKKSLSVEKTDESKHYILFKSSDPSNLYYLEVYKSNDEDKNIALVFMNQTLYDRAFSK